MSYKTGIIDHDTKNEIIAELSDADKKIALKLLNDVALAMMECAYITGADNPKAVRKAVAKLYRNVTEDIVVPKDAKAVKKLFETI